MIITWRMLLYFLHLFGHSRQARKYARFLKMLIFNFRKKIPLIHFAFVMSCSCHGSIEMNHCLDQVQSSARDLGPKKRWFWAVIFCAFFFLLLLLYSSLGRLVFKTFLSPHPLIYEWDQWNNNLIMPFEDVWMIPTPTVQILQSSTHSWARSG